MIAYAIAGVVGVVILTAALKIRKLNSKISNLVKASEPHSNTKEEPEKHPLELLIDNTKKQQEEDNKQTFIKSVEMIQASHKNAYAYYLNNIGDDAKAKRLKFWLDEVDKLTSSGFKLDDAGQIVEATHRFVYEAIKGKK